MESLYFLIPLSIVVLAVSLAGFFWAVKSGQYDDLDGDAERILFDAEVDADAPRAGRNMSLHPLAKPARGREDGVREEQGEHRMAESDD